VAEPMLPPTDKDFCDAEVIADAAYLSFRPATAVGSIDYFTPPIARFRILTMRHGKTLPQIFEVRYDFENGSSCVPPTDWTFSPSRMPEVGKVLRLFLNAGADGVFTTARGDEGRMSTGVDSDELLERCKKIWDNRGAVAPKK